MQWRYEIDVVTDFLLVRREEEEEEAEEEEKEEQARVFVYWLWRVRSAQFVGKGGWR